MQKIYAYLPIGYALNIITDAMTSGLYVQVEPGLIYTPTQIAASTNINVGPFNEPRNYEIYYDGNLPTYTIAQSGVYTKEDADAAFVPSLEANIPEITDSGELLAVPITIATVNSILDVLIANGMMEEPA